jgi:hypothetical protein
MTVNGDDAFLMVNKTEELLKINGDDILSTIHQFMITVNNASDHDNRQQYIISVDVHQYLISC